jgi:hypothetical protein
VNDTLMIWASIFLLLVFIVAATVPMWIPPLWRWLRQDDARLVCAEIERWEREMQRQQCGYESAVQRLAQLRKLPSEDWPALAEAMPRWWACYRDGRSTWSDALCEAEAWISRRARGANVPTSAHLGAS